jgi:CDP-diacylglycerol--glycerol-3-phosphate 3-phosphatidyltransferase
MANLISLIRTIMSLIVAGLLFIQTDSMYIACFILTVIIIWMDGLDGYVARKFNESSTMGAVVDILCDRIVEQVYWIAFLALGWVPLWMTLTVIIRGVLVDGLRSIALKEGFTAFGENTMMKSPVGVLLVSSRFSRWSYAVFKAIAFSFLILAYTPGWESPAQPVVMQIAMVSIYITVAFCVIRGLPVLVEGWRFFLPAGAKQ